MNRYMNANAAFSKFGRDYIALKRTLPIRPSEMGVLNIITQREGLFTPVMIAELLGVSKPMIAAHIASLEQKGYVYKESSSIDKRSFYVLPTEQAIALVEQSEEKMRVQLQAIESALGGDRFDLLVSLIEEAQSVLEQQNDLQ